MTTSTPARVHNPNLRFESPAASLFTRNREKLRARLQPGTAAIVFAHQLLPTTADATHPFDQNRNFYYLTGIHQQDAILLLFPDAPKDTLKEILFITRSNEQIQLWEGWRYSPDEARDASGIQHVRYLEDFELVLRQLVHLFSGVYLDFNEHDRNALYLETPAHKLAHRLQREWPAHGIHRLNPILSHLRLHKEPEEIAQIEEAIAITDKAFRRVLGFTRPGVMEYEIQAEILHEFIRNRATREAYESIIASGANACILHYTNNSRACQDGDLLLMDFGAQYGNYAADLTRTIPVNGRFTARQRAVYEAVHRVKDFATSLLRPGKPMQDYVAEVGLNMQEELLQLGLITTQEVKDAPADRPAYKKYFPHGISHPLGLNVHDEGSRYATFASGHLYTVEPGIYIPEEGIGVRIENNVLITDDAPRDLMTGIPSFVADIEHLMQA